MSEVEGPFAGVTEDLDTYLRRSAASQATDHLLDAIKGLSSAYDARHPIEAAERWHSWDVSIAQPLQPLGFEPIHLGIDLQYGDTAVKAQVQLELLPDAESKPSVQSAQQDDEAVHKLSASYWGLVYNLSPRYEDVAEKLGVHISVQRDPSQPARDTMRATDLRELQTATTRQLKAAWVAVRVGGVAFAILDECDENILFKGVVLDPAAERNTFNGDQLAMNDGFNPYVLLRKNIQSTRMRDTGNESHLGLDANDIITLASTEAGSTESLPKKIEVTSAARDMEEKVAKTARVTRKLLEAITASEDYQSKIKEAKAAA